MALPTGSIIRAVQTTPIMSGTIMAPPPGWPGGPATNWRTVRVEDGGGGWFPVRVEDGVGGWLTVRVQE